MSYPNLPTMATPPRRPLPGAYFQTPAPVSNPVPKPPAPVATTVDAAVPAPASLPKFPPAASKSKSQTLRTEERGARTVNDTLLQEARYPDLDNYLSRK